MSNLEELRRRREAALLGGGTDAIAKQHENIAREYVNNKLEEEDGPILSTMNNRVIGPLHNLADKSAIAATDLLDQARKAPDGASRERLLQQAVEQQIKVASEIRVIQPSDMLSPA